MRTGAGNADGVVETPDCPLPHYTTGVCSKCQRRIAALTDSLDRTFERYKAAQEEADRLRAENAELRERLSRSVVVAVEDVASCRNQSEVHERCVNGFGCDGDARLLRHGVRTVKADRA